MPLIRFLFHESSALVWVATLAGLCAGAASSAIVSLLNRDLRVAEVRARTLVWFLVMVAVCPVLSYLGRRMMGQVSQRATAGLRNRLCSRILHAPLRDIERIGAARLLASLTEEVNAVTAAMGGLPVLATSGAVVICCLVYIASLSVWVLLLIVGAMLAQIAAFRALHRRGLDHLARAAAHRNRLFQSFRALIDGSKELKLHGGRRAAFLSEMVEPITASVAASNQAGTTYFAAGIGVAQVLSFTTMGLLVFLPGGWVVAEPRLAAACLLALIFMTMHFDVLFQLPASFARANVALSGIRALGLSLDAVAEPPPDRAHVPSDWRRVALRDVSWTYQQPDGSRFSLGPIDLTIERNEILFVIGGNGSGKTTLAKVLSGLYIPDEGRILIDGRELASGDRDGYRQLFSAVFVDFFLFDTLLGLDSGRLDERAAEYLASLQLSDHVRIENGRLSTTALSQGQRKRLALLTAYLEDRPIYIFDEWAADQDPPFRELFYRRLLRDLKQRGKTIVVITHDDRYFDEADRTVKLEYGRIVAAESPSRAVAVAVS